ncbi:centromere protein S isoform X3 [Zootoca vivipara]|uniref:centromere protein S isoform X3 n=1 Tax=Zootoca vivipara TaxID=8524 RepID=UPI00293BF8A7|nr:centromere protein S isoform X3 [Zootoca vivipara]
MEAEATAVGRLSDTQVWGAGRCGVRPLRKRLKAACHYTVAGLCEEVSQDKEIQFSKQTIAAISEIAFRQCEYFAKDLEMFARHAKRSTVNLEDVKLLARRSKSLHSRVLDRSLLFAT